jgi:hypothetical protein
MLPLMPFGDFGKAFVDTHLAIERQNQLRDSLLQREKADTERLKLQQQELKGRQAQRQLQEERFLADLSLRQQKFQAEQQKFQAELAENQQQAQQRQQAGAAQGLLNADPDALGFTLEPESQAALGSIVTQQQAREGKIGDAAKQFQELQQRRGAIFEMDFSDLPAHQQSWAHAAVKAFRQGGLSGDGLFNFLNRLGNPPQNGRTGNRANLAYKAAQGDKAAEKALTLMGPAERSMALSELAWRAAGGDERATQALLWIERMRTAKPPSSRRRSYRDHEDDPDYYPKIPSSKDAPRTSSGRRIPVPGPGDHPTTHRGKAFTGKGTSPLPPNPEEEDDDLPKIKGFRRVR